MTKTLSQLKKHLTAGTVVELIKFEEARLLEDDTRGELEEIQIELIRAGHRFVCKVQTNGVWFQSKEGERASWMDFPKAGNVSYIDDTFTITELDTQGRPWQRRTYKIINFK